jgi:hypothetical protein
MGCFGAPLAFRLLIAIDPFDVPPAGLTVRIQRTEAAAAADSGRLE